MKGKLLLTSAALLILLLPAFSVKVNAASSAQIKVINPSTSNGDFIFSTGVSPVGTRFNATVEVDNVTDLFAYQATLNVNDTLLNITNAWLPAWDSAWVFDGKATIRPAPAFYDFDVDGYMESVKIGDTILMGETFTGDGLLAVIEFEIIYAPISGTVSCNLDIDNADTYLLDYDLTEIAPVTKMNGYYEYIGPAGPEPPHAEFTYSPLGPFIGTVITFDASTSTPNGGVLTGYIWNFDDGSPEVTEGDPVITHSYALNETFNVTLTVVDSEGLNDTTWQLVTVLFEPEINVDLNGDGKVDIKDVATVAVAFGSYPGHPRWDEIADVNKDDQVCMKDIVVVASNFGLIL